MLRFVLLLTIAGLAACKKDQTGTSTSTNVLVGKWTRTEVYVNPGNGGSWQPFNSVPPETLEFTDAGKLYANVNPYMNYSIYKLVGKDSLELTSTTGAKRYHSFTLVNGTLTISYPCIEGCGDRFVKK